MKKSLCFIKILIISVIFSFYVFMIPIYAFSPSDSNLYQGIDISHWQGDINFSDVKESGIDIVYIKSSEGNNYIDPLFEQNYNNAKSNGLYVGVYHYLTATTEEMAKQQANFFASVISGKQIDCKLAMDFEYFGNLNNTQINQISIAFLEQIQQVTGKEPVVYSDTYNATNTFSGNITNYPLWVAEYGVQNPNPNGNWETWVGFQYTDEGEVNGISGYVDRNKFTQEIFLSDTSEIPNIDKPNISIQESTTTIIIQYGDTLSEIAIMYNTTVARLVELNSISNPNLIYAGESLIVPTNTSTQASDDSIYIVKWGDTLTSIARTYNTTIAAIVNANQIQNPNLIFVGQRLIIPRSASVEITNDMNHMLYRVRRGDTLYAISRRYNTTIANIVRLNRIANPNLIFPGELLRI